MYARGCRDAMERLAAGSSSTAAAGSAAEVAAACARAYCPRLAEPKPLLCAETPPPSALIAGWAELQAAIWRSELGEAKLRALAPRMRAIAARSGALVAELARPTVARIDVRDIEARNRARAAASGTELARLVVRVPRAAGRLIARGSRRAVRGGRGC